MNEEELVEKIENSNMEPEAKAEIIETMNEWKKNENKKAIETIRWVKCKNCRYEYPMVANFCLNKEEIFKENPCPYCGCIKI